MTARAEDQTIEMSLRASLIDLKTKYKIYTDVDI